MSNPQPRFKKRRRQAVKAAVAAECERCAKIADDAVAAHDAAIEAIEGESWQWAMNEMSDGVCDQWATAMEHFRGLAAKIRSGAMTTDRDGPRSNPYRPTEMACGACCFGRGRHAPWCDVGPLSDKAQHEAIRKMARYEAAQWNAIKDEVYGEGAKP